MDLNKGLDAVLVLGKLRLRTDRWCRGTRRGQKRCILCNVSGFTIGEANTDYSLAGSATARGGEFSPNLTPELQALDLQR